MLTSLEVVRDRCRQKTLFDAQGKVSRESLDALSEAGYWGLLVDSEYSGQAASFQSFAKFLTQMATVEATVGGLASVHGCIGAVHPWTDPNPPTLASTVAICVRNLARSEEPTSELQSHLNPVCR